MKHRVPIGNLIFAQVIRVQAKDRFIDREVNLRLRQVVCGEVPLTVNTSDFECQIIF